VIGSELSPKNGQCALVQLARSLQLSSHRRDFRQCVESAGDIGMVGAEALDPYLQRAVVERVGFREIAVSRANEASLKVYVAYSECVFPRHCSMVVSARPYSLRASKYSPS
jgi:hypothetical protein